MRGCAGASARSTRGCPRPSSELVSDLLVRLAALIDELAAGPRRTRATPTHTSRSFGRRARPAGRSPGAPSRASGERSDYTPAGRLGSPDRLAVAGRLSSGARRVGHARSRRPAAASAPRWPHPPAVGLQPRVASRRDGAVLVRDLPLLGPTWIRRPSCRRQRGARPSVGVSLPERGHQRRDRRAAGRRRRLDRAPHRDPLAPDRRARRAAGRRTPPRRPGGRWRGPASTRWTSTWWSSPPPPPTS